MNLIQKFLIFLFGLLILVLILRCMRQSVTFTAEKFSESNEVLENPYQGYYHIIGYTLNDTDEAIASHADTYSDSLVLLEINLKNYKNTDISEHALSQLEQIFKDWSNTDTQILLRFLYDLDGIAKATEPDSLSTILTHIDQVSEIVNRYSDSIYLMQGIFIGNWGEMHGSEFMDDTSVHTLINHLNESIDSSIYLSVRTPAHWRMITNLYDVPKKFPAFQANGNFMTRLGLYNDGMLGSASDLGTYGDTNRKDATSPSYKGTREDELKFQNTLCQYVPNGGEVVSDNSYNDLPSAVESLTTMHVSYLNADYDNTVLDKWKNTTWNQNDAFYGCDGYTYIQAHLGYRYLVTKCTMKSSGFLNSQLNLSIGLQNTGFGNALKEFHATLKFKNTETGEISSVPIDYDLRKLKSTQKKTLSVSLPRKSLKSGSYQVFLSITDAQSEKQISLANTQDMQEEGLLLGRMEY